ncbi:MAG: hypothetical protein L6R38_005851 [Xanthoria sp. 2 TBL-2021]|nr:MAG: hypothetical protein L6R38_005851 [Xanthoria sp. 2 TBL-2021]
MKLYGFGSNGSGQLGIGNTEDTSLPQLCHLADYQEWPSPIKTIESGGNHTLVLLESGQLFVSGCIRDGRAGLPSLTDSITKFNEVPTSAFGGSKVKLCSALWEASIVVTDDNQLYTFGAGLKGELGTGKGVKEFPNRLENSWPNNEHIVDLSSGMGHTVIVLSNGDVYGWGNGRKGQLGAPNEIVWQPREVQNLSFRVVRAVCGTDFSYLVGEPGHGHHAILGSDKWKIRSNAPSSNIGWNQVTASWGSVFTLSTSGKFHAWGRNDYGQLGPDQPQLGFTHVIAGSEHAIALTESGTVVVWGWGEHGNCGPRINPQGDVKGWWNEIHAGRFGKSHEVVGIAAGCATTFVWTEETNDKAS